MTGSGNSFPLSETCWLTEAIEGTGHISLDGSIEGDGDKITRVLRSEFLERTYSETLFDIRVRVKNSLKDEDHNDP